MSNKQESNQWLQLQCPKEEFNTLVLIAGEQGKHVNTLVLELCRQGIVNYAKQTKNPIVRTNAVHLTHEAKELQIHQLKRLIVANEDHPDEERTELIKTLCDDSGIPMESLVEDMRKNPHVAELLKLDGVSQAQSWLMKNLTPGKPIAVKTLKDEATRSKYRWHTVQHARDRINVETNFYIRSEKNGVYWFWHLLDPNSPEDSDSTG